MSLSDVVDVTITAQTRTPSRTGFGLPLVMAYHTVWVERARLYTDVADMITDGFTATDPAVLAVTACFAQNPRPSQVLVGREEETQKQKYDITPIAQNSTVYTITINTTVYQYTSDATATVAEITAALEAAIDAVAWAGTTAYVVGDHVTNDTGPVKVYRCITAGTSAGAGGPTGTGSAITDGTVVWTYVGPDQPVEATDGTTKITIESDTIADQFTLLVSDRNLLKQENITPDGSPDGIVADITAVRQENDDWYCLLLTNQGDAVIQAAAAHIETLVKIHIAASADDNIYDSTVSDDLGSDLQTASYARTALIYQHKASSQYPNAAWAGKNLPKDPGSITWMFKTLAGVDFTDLTATETTTLDGKDVNMYIRLAGINITQFGKTSAGEFIDITRGTDWIRARLQENIFAALANNDKVPFTDPGVGIIENEIWGVLNAAIAQDVLAADPEPTVTVPLVADVSTADKAARLLPDVEFNATLAGAIHKVEIDGVVSV